MKHILILVVGISIAAAAYTQPDTLALKQLEQDKMFILQRGSEQALPWEKRKDSLMVIIKELRAAYRCYSDSDYSWPLNNRYVTLIRTSEIIDSLSNVAVGYLYQAGLVRGPYRKRAEVIDEKIAALMQIYGLRKKE